MAGLDWERLTGLLWDRDVAWDRKDDVLAALVRLSQGGDAEATAVVAVCLSPGLWANARGLIRLVGSEDGWGEILAGLCDRVARYDLERRPRRIAANLIWDARQHLRSAVQAHVRHAQHSRPEPNVGQHGVWPAPELSAETIVALAEQAGVIAPVDGALISATRISGLSLREAAGLLGIDYEVAKKRRQRAETNFASWWTDSESCPVPARRPTHVAPVIALPLRPKTRDGQSAASEG